MDLKKTLTYRMARFAMFHRIELERRLQPLGLHGGQIFVMFELWERDELTQAELAVRLGVAPPTITRMVRSLESGGFLEIIPSPADARVRIVRLTARGISIRNDVMDCWQSIEDSLAVQLTTTERLVLTDLAGKLTGGENSR